MSVTAAISAGQNPQIGVRFRGQTGKHLLALSLTGFDPQETCAALDCCYANRPLNPFCWA